MARCQTNRSRNESLIFDCTPYGSAPGTRRICYSLVPRPYSLLLEVLGIGWEFEVFVFLLVLIVVVEVAEAGGEGGCGQDGGRSGLRIAVLVDLHAERQAHLGEDLFDLIQGL